LFQRWSGFCNNLFAIPEKFRNFAVRKKSVNYNIKQVGRVPVPGSNFNHGGFVLLFPAAKKQNIFNMH
jgi:hypothetical protein